MQQYGQATNGHDDDENPQISRHLEAMMNEMIEGGHYNDMEVEVSPCSALHSFPLLFKHLQPFT